MKCQRYSRAVAAIIITVSAGCGPAIHHAISTPPESALVYFTNETLDQADVYAISASQRTRIGTVMAGRTEALFLPSALISSSEVRVAARLLARNGLIDTGPVQFNAGDTYDIRLPSVGNNLLILPARR